MNALSASLGGGQTYVNRLLDYVPEHYSGKIYVLAPESLELSTQHPAVERVPVTSIVVTGVIFRTLWEKFCLPRLLRKLGIGVLFCPGGLLNTRVPAGCKKVVTFQNMLPFSKSNWQNTDWVIPCSGTFCCAGNS